MESGVFCSQIKLRFEESSDIHKGEGLAKNIVAKTSQKEVFLSLAGSD